MVWVEWLSREVRKATSSQDPWVLHKLAQWRVVQSKLLPMMSTYMEDKYVPSWLRARDRCTQSNY
jgi:hypothetical protein